jgi:hypothetical protein
VSRIGLALVESDDDEGEQAGNDDEDRTGDQKNEEREAVDLFRWSGGGRQNRGRR